MDDDEKKMLFNEINILKGLVSRFYPLPGIPKYPLSLLEGHNSLTNIKFHIYLPYIRITPILSRCTSSSRMRSATTLLLSNPPIFLILLTGSAKEENFSMKLLLEVNLLRKMPLSL